MNTVTPTSWRQRLPSAVRGEVRLDEPMARHTTLRVGGPVDAWVAPADVPDVQALRAFAAAEGVRCWPLGAGSNLLVRDGGVRGIAVSLEKLRRLARSEDDATQVLVEAGVSTGKLLQAATLWELGGVEFLGGVPGSVGGGLVMNAGTVLGEFKDVTHLVRSVDAAGRMVDRDGAACGFVYRGSAIPSAEIVVDAVLHLRPRPRADIEADVAALRKRRREREPKAIPNAGSFFKNPPGDFAGRLIEAAGLKGRRVGGTEVSRVHANWLVNASAGAGARARDRASGRATAADFIALIDIVRAEVERRFSVTLELEVRIVGDDPAASAAISSRGDQVS